MENKKLRANRVTPESERYKTIEGRQYFYMDSKGDWKGCTQGRYNIMLANDYTVWYADNDNELPPKITGGYCEACNKTGMLHCAHPEECGEWNGLID